MLEPRRAADASSMPLAKCIWGIEEDSDGYGEEMRTVRSAESAHAHARYLHACLMRTYITLGTQKNMLGVAGHGVRV